MICANSKVNCCAAEEQTYSGGKFQAGWHKGLSHFHHERGYMGRTGQSPKRPAQEYDSVNEKTKIRITGNFTG
jgi:hypothetical protein